MPRRLTEKVVQGALSHFLAINHLDSYSLRVLCCFALHLVARPRNAHYEQHCELRKSALALDGAHWVATKPSQKTLVRARILVVLSLGLPAKLPEYKQDARAYLGAFCPKLRSLQHNLDRQVRIQSEQNVRRNASLPENQGAARLAVLQRFNFPGHAWQEA